MDLSRPVRSVVFDLDGLLIDTEPIFEEAARRLLARRGRALQLGVLQRMMGSPAAQVFPLFREAHGLTETVEELLAESTTLFMAVLGEAPAPLMAGAMELLDRLNEEGLPRAIATSSSAAYAERVLRPHRLLPYFDFVLSCDDVRIGKPHPEVYEMAAARWGWAPAEMVVLEDSVNGLRAAKAAGARCVVVPHPLVPLEQLTGADLIVTSLREPSLHALLGL